MNKTNKRISERVARLEEFNDKAAHVSARMISGGAYIVRYYDTDIVAHATTDGTTAVTPHGFNTRTTRDRINAVLSGLKKPEYVRILRGRIVLERPADVTPTVCLIL